jgi:hypothetical protein
MRPFRQHSELIHALQEFEENGCARCSVRSGSLGVEIVSMLRKPLLQAICFHCAQALRPEIAIVQAVHLPAPEDEFVAPITPAAWSSSGRAHDGLTRPWAQDDRRWFQARPSCLIRLRYPRPAELLEALLAQGTQHVEAIVAAREAYGDVRLQFAVVAVDRGAGSCIKFPLTLYERSFSGPVGINHVALEVRVAKWLGSDRRTLEALAFNRSLRGKELLEAMLEHIRPHRKAGLLPFKIIERGLGS